MCCAADVLEGKGAVQVSITVSELLRFHTPNNFKSPLKKAVGATASANATPSPTKANQTITAMLTSP